MTRHRHPCAAIAGILAIAAGACGGDDDTDKAEAPSGSLSQLAMIVNAASQAALDAVLDREVADKWRFPEQAKPALEKARRVVRGYGDAQRLITIVELEAVRPEQRPSYLRTTAAVFPDGRVAWLSLAAKSGPLVVSATTGLEAASPELAGGVQAMIDTIASDQCETLPMLQPSDVVSLMPRSISHRFKNGRSLLPPVCNVMRGQSDGWSARVDDLTIVVGTPERAGILETGFDVAAGRLKLRTPQAVVP